jgi:AcrR family transcriptional regulator
MAIADADGLAAVSMRRIAAELGSGTMSLYRHVPTKEDLLDLMLDAAMAEVDVPNRAHDMALAGRTDLRSQLTAIGYGQRAMLHRHPWLSQVMATRPSFGPNVIRILESALSIFDGRGVHPDTMMTAIGALNAFVSGFVTEELGAAEARRRTGLSEAQWREQMAPYLRSLLSGGSYPRVARFVREGDNAFEMDPEQQFAAQLDFVLDGILARVNSSAP